MQAGRNRTNRTAEIYDFLRLLFARVGRPHCPHDGRPLERQTAQQMVDAILAMKKEGVSIVVSEQNLHFARLISDRAYIIERGKICYGGTMAELDARPDIRDAHLSL